MELTSENVDKVALDCLYPDSYSLEEAVREGKMVEGIVTNFVFQPAKLIEHTEDIKSMLLQLPDEFKASKGGGWSFLNACNRSDSVQWTGLHAQMETLFMLGMAIGFVTIPLPRDFWPLLPGGVPYFVINDN